MYDCVGSAYGGYGWCSTSTMYSKNSWGGCRRPQAPSERYIRWPDDVRKAIGNNSAPDDKCKFPFYFEGGKHTDCANRGKDMPHGWCSLDEKFKGRWGACAPEGYKPATTEKGARWTDGKKGTVPAYQSCTFPFYYRGKRFDGCVNKSPQQPHGWCSTTEEFSNKWGSCMAPGESPPPQNCKLTDWSQWTRG